MGLDTTHNCWHGPYSLFHIWRTKLCQVAGLGNIDEYEGFGGIRKWPEDDIITVLLSHSDCDGEIQWKHTKELAKRLEKIIPQMDEFEEETRQFVKGLRNAHRKFQKVEFH